MAEILYKDESYKIMGILFEVHNNLGKGFSEIVYKDALEYEFKNSSIQLEREKEYAVHYKEITLKHKFYADFIVYDKIVLEIKVCKSLKDDHLQ
jgi:GxxExxY protein